MWAATMKGQSCGNRGAGELFPDLFWASDYWGRRVSLHRQRCGGIPQVRWVHLARHYVALQQALAADGHHSLCGHVVPSAFDGGPPGLVCGGRRVRPRAVVWGGGAYGNNGKPGDRGRAREKTLRR